MDEVEETRDELFGLSGCDVFGSHELVGFLHLFVDGLDSGVMVEEALESGFLWKEEFFGMGA